MQGQDQQGYKFDPLGSLAWKCAIHESVLALPDPAPRGILRAGLFDANGQHIAAADCWTTENRPATQAPDPANRNALGWLPGLQLYGGILSGHFGHLICEGTARLWALDQPRAVPDGLVYFSRDPTKNGRILRRAKGLLAALGIDAPCSIIDQPTRLEAVLLAPQAFGTDALLTGTPEFRHFMRARLAGRTPAPQRERRLYLSRGRLPRRRGVLIGERRLEALLSEQGFEIYHPESHSLSEQVAAYRAAAGIAATEGSPLHLVGFAAARGTPVVMLERRKGGPAPCIADSLTRFLLRSPALVPALSGGWRLESGRQSVLYHVLDLPAVHAALLDRGMVEGPAWPPLDPDAIRAELSDIEVETGGTLTRLADTSPNLDIGEPAA
ncbi:MAG: glycosyltransferase 61 family protein [Pseudomonadota bacterium]